MIEKKTTRHKLNHKKKRENKMAEQRLLTGG